MKPIHHALTSLFLGLLVIVFGCGHSSVIRIGDPKPEIIRLYRSLKVYGFDQRMVNSGIQLKEGDYVTIMATGELGENRGKEFRSLTPEETLLWQIGESGKSYAYTYFGRTFSAKESGFLILGIAPNLYKSLSGTLTVEIIVWKKEDPVAIEKFFTELLSKDPENRTLKEYAGLFGVNAKYALAEEKVKKELEETQKALLAAKKEEVPGQAEQQKSSTTGNASVKTGNEEKYTSAETHSQGLIIKSPEEKKIAELTERLQKAMQALKELEEMKKKMAEQQQKEFTLVAQLKALQSEKKNHPQTPPIIAIANPKDGVIVDSEYISLAGVAEHVEGIIKFEILVNKEPTPSDKRDVKVIPKSQRRIDFSERIRLREGKNEISVIAEDKSGARSIKTVNIQMVKNREEIWAVVIGINKYVYVPPLKYAENDARAFYEYLVEVNKVPKDHIWLLINEEASLDKLRSVLGTQLRRKAAKGDMVIIYLAGHGATEKDSSTLDGDGLEKYILPYNADPKDLYASAMPMVEVSRIFQRISAEKLVFIGDTCYSGATGGRTIAALGARANVSGSFLDRLSQGKGRVIITASDANQISIEKDELKHGVFTYYLLEGLRGKADSDGDGVVTVDEIYKYVSMKVPKETGQDQHPVKKGETTGEIVLGVVK